MESVSGTEQALRLLLKRGVRGLECLNVWNVSGARVSQRRALGPGAQSPLPPTSFDFDVMPSYPSGRNNVPAPSYHLLTLT